MSSWNVIESQAEVVKKKRKAKVLCLWGVVGLYAEVNLQKALASPKNSTLTASRYSKKTLHLQSIGSRR